MRNSFQIGHVLKKIRIAKLITIADASSAIGITGTYIRLIESNKKIPTIFMLAKICDFYNITISEVFKMTE